MTTYEVSKLKLFATPIKENVYYHTGFGVINDNILAQLDLQTSLFNAIHVYIVVLSTTSNAL